MSETAQTIGKRIRDWLKNRYGSAIKAVILYGSHVRGDATQESDIDLLVVVDSSLDPWEIHRSLDGLLFDILLETEQLVSVVVFPEDLYERYSSPFLMNVRREGMAL